MTAKEFDPVAWWKVHAPIDGGIYKAVIALAAEAAKQQARRDAEICREKTTYDEDDPGESFAQAIEKEAGLSQDVPTVREG